MKSSRFSFLFFLLFLVASNSGFPQWTMIYSNPSYSFTKVLALNDNIAYAIGDNGLLLRTSNGGLNWNQIVLPSSARLFDIGFPTSMIGYICGSSGLVLKTTDSGLTWIQCQSTTNLSLRCLTFNDENTLWFGGSSSNDPMTFRSDAGIIIKTVDGGNSFVSENDFLGAVQNIKYYNSDTCFAIINTSVGQNNIWRTTDLISDWQIINMVPGEHPLTSLIVLSTGKLLVTPGFNYLVESKDGGNIWQEMFVQGSYGNVIDQSFPSSKIGYACGWDFISSMGEIVKTTDSASTWIVQKTGKFQSISFTNDTLGYAVTADGNIFKTGDGGGLDNIHPLNNPSLEISVFPNPSSKELYFKISPAHLSTGSLTLEIFNSVGQRVSAENISSELTKIECWSDLPTGIYCLVLRNWNSTFYSRKELKIDVK
jgi:photosystem II stability/assembly factor-like uncharacterized protein